MSTTTVKVLSATKEVASHTFKKGEVLVIQASENVNYQLIDDVTGRGPQNILAKRDGKNLVITLDQENNLDPDIIIENYYGDDNGETTNLLVGLHENGNIYAYVPESGQTADAVSMLAEEMVKPQALGGHELKAFLWAFNPWWLVGAAAVIGGVALAAGSKGGKKGSSTQQANKTEKPTVEVTHKDTNGDGIDDVTTISGTAPAGSTINIDTNGDGTPDTTVTADGNGKYTTDISSVIPAGTKVGVTATQPGKQPSDKVEAESPVVDTTPVAPADVADTPTISEQPVGQDGDAPITTKPGDDNTKVTTTYTDEDGNPQTIVATKDPVTGNWTATDTNGNPVSTTPTTDDKTPFINPTTGEVTLPKDAVDNEKPVKVTGEKDGSTPSTTEVDRIDTPTISSQPVDQDGDAPITTKPGDDNTKVTTTYTDEDGNPQTIVATKDPVTGNWTATDTNGNPVSTTPTTDDKTPFINPTTGEVTLPKDSVDNSKPVNVTAEKEVPATQPTETSQAPEVNPVDTDDTTVTGTGTPGATVSVTVPGSDTPVTTTVTPEGTWSVPVSNLPKDGEVSVTQTEPGKNPSTPATATVTEAPATQPTETSQAPEVNPVDTDDTTVTGTGTPGATVSVTVPGSDTPVTTTVTPEGTWSVPVSNLPKDGEVSVTQTEPGKNPSTPATATVTEAPATQPTETSQAPEVNPVDTDDTTVTGTGTPGATVSVTVPGSDTPVTTTVTPEGTWSVPVSNLPKDGEVSVTQTEPGKNPSTPATATVTEAPATQPTETSQAPEVNPVDTDDTTVTGTGTPGATVSVTVPGSDTPVTTTVTPEGTWSVPVSNLPKDGEVSVTQTEPGKNPSTPATATVTEAPATQPTETSQAPEVNPVDTDDTTVTGTGTPGATVSVTVPGSDTPVTTTVTPEGTWSVPVSNLPKDGEVSVTQTEPGKNPSTPATATVTEAPATQPTETSQAPEVNPVDTDDTTVTGTGTPGAMVSVTVPGSDTPVTTTVTPEGTWSVPVSNLPKDGEVSVTQTEPGKNPSTPATATVTEAPATQPTETSQAPEVNPVDTDDTTVTGTGTPGATVSVTVPGSDTPVTTTVTPEGTWSVPVSNLPKDGEVSVTQTEPGKNPSTPATATVTEAPATQPTETSQAPEVNPVDTDDTTVTGTGTPGATVSVTVPGSDTPVTTTVTPEGTWSVPVSNLPKDGEVSVTQTEPGKNPSTPATATVTEAPATQPTETSQAPEVNPVDTDDTTVTGTGTPGATVSVTVPGSDTPVTTTVTPEGTWSVPVSNLPKDGEVSVTQTEPGKNPSTPATATVTEAPATQPTETSQAPEVNPVDTDDTTVTGTGTPGATVSVTVPGSDTPVTTTVTPEGTWSVPVSNLPKDGEVSVTQTEPGKNPSTPATATVTEAPATQPTETSQAPEVNPVDTDDTTVTGTGTPGATVSVTVPGSDTPVTTTVTPEGTWSVPVSNLPKDGEVSVTQTEPGKNPSTPATATVTEAPATQPTETSQAPEVNPVDTDDTTVTGTGTPGATVSVTVPGSDTPVTTTVTPEGTWSVPVSNLPKDGEVSVTQTEPGKNPSTPATATVTEAPATQPTETSQAPEVNPVDTDDTTVTGTGTPGATVSVTVPGSDTPVTTTVTPEGTWSVPVSNLPKDGEVSVTQTEPGKNPSTPATATVTEAPATQPTETSQAPEVNPVDTDDTTVTGTGTPGATVSVTVPGSDTPVTTTVTPEGTWSVPVSNLPKDGEVSVTQTEPGKNPSTPATATVTEAPATQPTETSQAPEVNPVDTDDTTVTGTGTPGATVSVTVPGSDTPVTTTVTPEGTWSVPVSNLPKDGEVSVTQTEPGKNPSTPATATVTEAPATQPTETSQAPEVNPVDTDDTTVTGTGTPGATVSVTVPGSDTPVTTTVTPEGTWSVPVSNLPKDGEVSVTQTEPGKNPSTPATATVTEAPATQPTETSQAPEVNPVDTDDTTVTGTGTPGATVSVTVPGSDTPVTTTVTPEGTWSVPVSNLPKDGEVSVTQTEPGKNPSTPATATVTEAPATQPTETSQAPEVNPVDTDDTTVTGTGTPGATVSVTVPGSDTPVTTTVTPEGTWSVPVSNLPKDGEVSVTQTEPGKNPSTPATATVTEAPATQPTETSQAPEVNPVDTDDTTVTGTGTPGATVSVTVPGSDTPVTTTVTPEGTWSVPVSNLPKDGEVSVTQTEPGKNPSTPATATVTEAPATQPTETSQAPEVNPVDTDDTTVTGTGTPGATVSVTVPGSDTPVTTTVTPEGTWSVPVSNLPKDGEVSVTQTEPGKNPSTPATATVTEAPATQPTVEEPVLSIAADQTDAAEGSTFTFTVTRTGDTTGESSATWTVAGSGTNAADNADFGSALTGTVTFAAGETSKQITVSTNDDANVEKNETFSVTLSTPTGATLGTAAATSTINNNDALKLELKTDSLGAGTKGTNVDKISNVPTVNFVGIENGQEWEYRLDDAVNEDGEAVWTAGTGTSLELPDPKNGEKQAYKVTARLKGQEGTEVTDTFTYDKVATLSQVSFDEDRGSIVVTGIAEKGSVVSIAGLPNVNTLVEADDGRFTLTISGTTSGTFTVETTDAAGNTDSGKYNVASIPNLYRQQHDNIVKPMVNAEENNVVVVGGKGRLGDVGGTGVFGAGLFNDPVNLGSGDDVLTVAGAIGYSTTVINMGTGDDVARVKAYISGGATLNMGDGDDFVKFSDTTLGTGRNLYNSNASIDNATVDLGNGNDTIEMGGGVKGNNGSLNGGAGFDTYVLTAPSNNGADSINFSLIKGIETFDMSNAGGTNNVRISTAAARQNGDTFNEEVGFKALVINGGTTDTVDLGASTSATGTTSRPNLGDFELVQSVDGKAIPLGYNGYMANGDPETLVLIQQGIQVY